MKYVLMDILNKRKKILNKKQKYNQKIFENMLNKIG